MNQMKKLISVLFVLSLCVSVCAFACEGNTYDASNLYSLTTIVTDVDYDNDVVTCEDFSGNLWDFFGCEDWAVGDIVSMVMYDNGTAIIYDDEIVSMRYCGWFGGWEW